MRIQSVSSMLLPLCLGLALSAVALAHDPTETAHAPMPLKKDAASAMNMDASMRMHRVMMPGKPMEMPMSGNVDKDFAALMSMHHQQAIAMVDIYLKSGRNDNLKAMAIKMKATQQAEVKQMATYK